MSIPRTILLAACCAGFVAIGCKGENKSQSSTSAPTTAATSEPTAAAGDPAAQAKKVFKSKCVVCHGDKGAGDGPGAAALNPKPRAFSDASWQGEVTDDQIQRAIVQGGAAVGKSAAMPANPDLRNKDDVVKELVKIIRGFKS